MRDVHPLAPALPVIRRLLVSDAADSGVVVAITAADGTLLWVEGDRTAWPWIVNCRSVGRSTSRGWPQPWSCTAVPVHDLDTAALIGAIDLTGGSRVASPQTVALVRATVVAVENHLALLRLTGPKSDDTAPGAARLVVLGADRPDGKSPTSTVSCAAPRSPAGTPTYWCC